LTLLSSEFQAITRRAHDARRIHHFHQGRRWQDHIVAKTEQAIVVKTGRATFAVLNRNLVTEDPEEGVKMRVNPYVSGAVSTDFARIPPRNTPECRWTVRHTR
jgi:hypothetical protein